MEPLHKKGVKLDDENDVPPEVFDKPVASIVKQVEDLQITEK